MCRNHIRLRHIGVDSQYSLGEGETYDKGMGKIFQKLRTVNPTAHKVDILQLAVFAINTSVNMQGLIPMFLVQGMLPRLPGIAETGSLLQDQRVRILHAAREEYATFIAQRRVAQGLNKKVPSIADALYEDGDRVYL